MALERPVEPQQEKHQDALQVLNKQPLAPSSSSGLQSDVAAVGSPLLMHCYSSSLLLPFCASSSSFWQSAHPFLNTSAAAPPELDGKRLVTEASDVRFKGFGLFPPESLS